MSIFKSVKTIDISTLDMSIVKQLEKHDDLLDAIDTWTMFSARELIPKLLELSKIMDKLYPPIDKLIVYRGFNINSSFQEHLGIKNRNIKVNDKFTYKDDINAVSFTTDIEIARSFGHIVINTELIKGKHHWLNITNELSYLIYTKKRNRHDIFHTQFEVILFPPFVINGKVIEYKKPFWVIW